MRIRGSAEVKEGKYFESEKRMTLTMPRTKCLVIEFPETLKHYPGVPALQTIRYTRVGITAGLGVGTRSCELQQIY